MGCGVSIHFVGQPTKTIRFSIQDIVKIMLNAHFALSNQV